MPGPKNIYHDKKLFIEIARTIHGHKYDYNKISLNGSTHYIDVVCNECGTMFRVKPWDHLYGSHGQGRGCPKCANKQRSQTLTKDNNYFFQRIQSRKDKGQYYDYSKVVYTKATDPIEIICPKHGSFFQTPWSHIRGAGCPHCGMEITVAARQDNWDSYYKKIQNKRLDKGQYYDYSKVVYTKATDPIEIICPKHGSFFQTPSKHLRGGLCPMCHQSKLERDVEIILTQYNIIFEREKMFDWLGQQRCDFYLPKYKMVIECQGIQHYKPIPMFNRSRTFEQTKLADQRKRSLCNAHGLSVRYIKYSEPNIGQKLKSILNI